MLDAFWGHHFLFGVTSSCKTCACAVVSGTSGRDGGFGICVAACVKPPTNNVKSLGNLEEDVERPNYAACSLGFNSCNTFLVTPSHGSESRNRQENNIPGHEDVHQNLPICPCTCYPKKLLWPDEGKAFMTSAWSNPKIFTAVCFNWTWYDEAISLKPSSSPYKWTKRRSAPQ